VCDYVNTCNAPALRMSGKQIRLHVPPKLFGANSWILRMTRQWIPDCWSGDRKCTSPKGITANSLNWRLMTSGRWQMLETRNFTDWHTAVRDWTHSVYSHSVNVLFTFSECVIHIQW